MDESSEKAYGKAKQSKVTQNPKWIRLDGYAYMLEVAISYSGEPTSHSSKWPEIDGFWLIMMNSNVNVLDIGLVPKLNRPSLVGEALKPNAGHVG